MPSGLSRFINLPEAWNRCDAGTAGCSALYGLKVQLVPRRTRRWREFTSGAQPTRAHIADDLSAAVNPCRYSDIGRRAGLRKYKGENRSARRRMFSCQLYGQVPCNLQGKDICRSRASIIGNEAGERTIRSYIPRIRLQRGSSALNFHPGRNGEHTRIRIAHVVVEWRK